MPLPEDRLAEVVAEGIIASLDVAPLDDHIGTMLYEADVAVSRRAGQTIRIDVKIKGYSNRRFDVHVRELD